MLPFACCNSQSETLIVANKPIRLRESYRQCLLFLCVTNDLGHALKKTPFAVAAPRESTTF